MPQTILTVTVDIQIFSPIRFNKFLIYQPEEDSSLTNYEGRKRNDSIQT